MLTSSEQCLLPVKTMVSLAPAKDIYLKATKILKNTHTHTHDLWGREEVVSLQE